MDAAEPACNVHAYYHTSNMTQTFKRPLKCVLFTSMPQLTGDLVDVLDLLDFMDLPTSEKPR